MYNWFLTSVQLIEAIPGFRGNAFWTHLVFSKTKGSPAPEALGRGTFRPLLKTLSASECVPPKPRYNPNQLHWSYTSVIRWVEMAITIDYFKSAPSAGFCVFICFVKGSEYMHAPFFWEDNTLRRSPGKIYFSPGVPPWPHMTPCRRVNLGNIRYFEARGFLEE